MKRVVSLSVFILALVFGVAFAANGQMYAEFTLFAPSDAEVEDTHSLVLGGTEVNQALYHSSQSEAALANYYNGLFDQYGYEVVTDEDQSRRSTLK